METTELKKSDFYYELPEELIAQDPLEKRSSSRLLVLDKNTGEFRHDHFESIVGMLRKGDCLVINNTKVIPARLIGTRVVSDDNEDTDESENDGNTSVKKKKWVGEQPKECAVEVFLLKRIDGNRWETIVKPGKKLRTGAKVRFGNGELKGVIEEVKDDGNRIVRFDFDGIFEEILDKLGTMPLPPYITHELKDRDRYQTVYAKHEGSVAAPTAGLHFTKELLTTIREKGVDIAEVTLHVGLGTFRPVKEDNILNHHMHSEFYIVTPEAADKINSCKKNGGRVICVGTTSCRTIESAADENGIVRSGSADTEIFIYPGYKFKVLDCLITNFHLPESTLIMLVSALAGRENVLKAYEAAVQERYRFFSFGDAMFITDDISLNG